MKVLIFSDAHAHPFKYGAKEVSIEGYPGSFNSRLVDTVLAIQEMLDYAKSNSIHNVWFCGDLFNVKNDLYTDVFSLVHKVISKAAKEGIHFILLP